MLNLRLTMSAALALSLLASVPTVQCGSATAAATAASSGGDTLISIPYEKYKLKNGLEVILSEDHRLPLVATNIWYHVGPANERQGLTGFAHLFEHMMFEGSKHVGPKAHFKVLESAGATGVNGTTYFDRTNYFETLPSNQLELALWLESDRMGYLYDTLDREKLANQRDVVRNERRQSIEGAPYGIVFEELFHQLFPKGHPYHARVIGSHADIEAARLDDVREFFKQFYGPNNASLAIVGDFDKTKVKALVEKYFGTLPAGPEVPKVEATTPTITAEKHVTVTDQVELPRVVMGWLAPPIFKAGSAEAELAARILGGGKSSRLYKKLVYEQQIAQDVSVDNSALSLGSVFSLEATAKAGVKNEDLEKAINEELENFRKNGPTQNELDGARNVIEADMIRGLESVGGMGGIANKLNEYNHYLGDPGYLPKDLERYNKVTLQDVKAMADSYLQDKSRVVIYAVPGKKVLEDVPKTPPEKEANSSKGSSGMPDEPWRATQPKPGPEAALNLPAPKMFELSNGLKVYLQERHNLPIVSAELTFLSGTDANPINKPGLASFTADMLDYGTSTRSAMKIADDLELIGTQLDAGSSADASNVSLVTLSKTADQAFDIFSDVVLHPAFDQKEIERMRSLKVTALAQEKDRPRQVARRVLYKVLFGSKNPYGFVEDGTIESVKSFNRDDIVNFWKSSYVPSNAALVVVGDMSEAQVHSFAEKYFGKWSGSPAPHPSLEAKTDIQRTVYLVNKDAAPQTAVTVGTLGMARSNPDYIPSQVMNNAFGGLASSRLDMNLREEHGYTYGASSTFSYRRFPGAFAAGANVRTDVTGPAVAEIFKEFDLMHTKPLTHEEMKLSKDNFVLSLPGQFESSGRTAASFASLFVYGLPLDYYKSLPAKVNDVTDADVSRVVSKYMKPLNMVVITVGDKAKIEPELKKLNLGNFVELDYEANPLNK